MKNKQIITTSIGDSSVMKMIETEITAPLKNQVQIEITHTGFAWADVIMRRTNMYPNRPKLPLVQGYDVIGEIISVGEGVSKNNLGKKIAAIIQWGGFSQYINLDFEKVIEIPDALNEEKCEALILNYVTAYQVMFRFALVAKGDVILVHGAGGGVGSAILQLAKLRGIKAYGTASKAKAKTVRDNGGIFIDYQTQNFKKEIEKLEPNGISAFFDFNGGEIFNRSFKLLKPKGIAIVYNIQEAKSMIDAGKLMLKFGIKNIVTSKKVVFYSIMNLYKKNPSLFKNDLIELFMLLKEGKINPVISEVITLDQIPEKHNDFENNMFTGKVVVKIQ